MKFAPRAHAAERIRTSTGVVFPTGTSSQRVCQFRHGREVSEAMSIGSRLPGNKEEREASVPRDADFKLKK